MKTAALHKIAEQQGISAGYVLYFARCFFAGAGIGCLMFFIFIVTVGVISGMLIGDMFDGIVVALIILFVSVYVDSKSFWHKKEMSKILLLFSV
jgi:hypothetical protein